MARDWGSAKRNIEWVFHDESAKLDLLSCTKRMPEKPLKDIITSMRRGKLTTPYWPHLIIALQRRTQSRIVRIIRNNI